MSLSRPATIALVVLGLVEGVAVSAAVHCARSDESPPEPPPTPSAEVATANPVTAPRYPRPIMRVTDTSMATRVVLSPGWP